MKKILLIVSCLLLSVLLIACSNPPTSTPVSSAVSFEIQNYTLTSESSKYLGTTWDGEGDIVTEDTEHTYLVILKPELLEGGSDSKAKDSTIAVIVKDGLGTWLSGMDIQRRRYWRTAKKHGKLPEQSRPPAF